MLFVGFGLLFGSIFNVKSVGGRSSMLVICQSLLSGTWFPLDKRVMDLTCLLKQCLLEAGL